MYITGGSRNLEVTNSRRALPRQGRLVHIKGDGQTLLLNLAYPVRAKEVLCELI